ncbi:hypothetical protein SAMN05421786_106196 [Chryseobacterium ureilyticum]|uniref:Uncharacterized protein n=1 Tax=Chryseobacterium ureilyticum TaxID=373668 RepID=A0A1N7PU40_9FLAO|nr:hypothetical protein [Chryseobacterium ureilyticum]SIT14134.1 hypothetical protein SAMN05421786_106196 [Chryseobacterium ureilyticum]
MVQKQDGTPKKKIKEIYKFLGTYILIFLFLFNCKGQEHHIIGEKFRIEDYGKVTYNNGVKILDSEIFKKLFNEKKHFFIEKGWQNIEGNTSIIEFSPIDKSKNTFVEYDNKYLFIIKDSILRDTLKIKKDYYYSICQLDKQNNKHGIAIGKYIINNNDEFFEIHQVYSVDNGKLKNETLDIKIYDCPAPTNYIRDEEPNSYKFGVLNGKKLDRFWYQNIAEKKFNDNFSNTLQDWEGLYLNSDDKKLKTYQSIIDKVGWFKLKITAHEILFSADTRMRDDYPQTDPGGVYISNRCNYYISNDNTIEIYRKEYDDPNNTPVNIKGKKEDLLITLYKKDKEFFGTSNVIKDSEQYDNSARIKSNTPYQFYKFSLEENKN